MKKISILGVCLLTGLAAMAQVSLVKDVEHTLKGSSPDFQKGLNDVQPALTNSETAGTMMPWYLAGKAGFGLYDNLYVQESLGATLTPDQKKTAGHALVDGYNYYFKALHLDSVPNEKGKIKPKKSKEILKAMASNYLSSPTPVSSCLTTRTTTALTMHGNSTALFPRTPSSASQLL